MKYIFLDIDGVLATFRQFLTNKNRFQTKHKWAKELNVTYPFDKGCVKILNEILDKTDATIILSSDWGLYYDVETLNVIFQHNGITHKIKECTPKINVMFGDMVQQRYDEIKQYITENNVENYVIIDDLPLEKYMTEEEKWIFCKTKDFEGLKQSNLKEKVIEKLNSW